MVWGPMGPRCIKCSSYNVSQAGVGVSITDQPNPLPETSTPNIETHIERQAVDIEPVDNQSSDPRNMVETSTLREQLVEMFRHDLYDLGASRVETNNLSHDWANMIADLIYQAVKEERERIIAAVEETTSMYFGRDVPVFKDLADYMEKVAKIREIQRKEIVDRINRLEKESKSD